MAFCKDGTNLTEQNNQLADNAFARKLLSLAVATKDTTMEYANLIRCTRQTVIDLHCNLIHPSLPI